MMLAAWLCVLVSGTLVAIAVVDLWDEEDR